MRPQMGMYSTTSQQLGRFLCAQLPLGRANETHVEITAGLETGERYATTETFMLKAELGKGAASHEH